MVWGLIVLFLIGVDAGGVVPYFPNIAAVVQPNRIDISGSLVSSGQNVVQEVTVMRGATTFPSAETPAPFSSTLVLVTIPGIATFLNGDRLIHSYYWKTDALPFVSTCVVYFNAYIEGYVVGQYPLSFFFQGTLVTVNSLAELDTWFQQNMYHAYVFDATSGHFMLFVLCNQVTPALEAELTKNLTRLEPLTVQLNTKLGTSIFYVPVFGYVLDAQERFPVIQPSTINIRIDFDDGTPPQLFNGVYGPSNMITHLYGATAPDYVNVTIVGSMSSFSSVALGWWNPMMVDILSWGNTGLTQVDLQYEEFLERLTAGQPPPQVTDYYGFFPYRGTHPQVWQSLDQWDWDRVVIANQMFYKMRYGSLNLTGASFQNLKYAYQMFYDVEVPIHGALVDMRAPQLLNAEMMFIRCKGGPLDLSRLQTSNVKNFRYMFSQYRGTFEFDVSTYDTSSAETLEQMFELSYMAWPNLNITYWNTASVRNLNGFLYGCDQVKPIFTGWTLTNVLSCDYMINSSTWLGRLTGLGSGADYNQILIDFNTKTSPTLRFDWGSIMLTRKPINGIPTTPAALAAKQNLITNRGCSIVDLQ